MKEYTLLASISVVIAIGVDLFLKTRLLKRKDYYVFLAIIFTFKFLVNGYLTGMQIVRYNPDYFLGLRLGSIPVEDFLFGFSMITMTIVFWEYFKVRGGSNT